MKSINFFPLFLLLLAGFQNALSAQKLGYTNSAAILIDMPETKQADGELETFQKQLEAKGQEMAKAFEAELMQYQQDLYAGLLNPVQQEERQQALAEKEQALQAYQQEAYAKLAEKREELYGPILEKLQKAIDAVGKEHGYAFIFDVSSLNFILFAEESDDVTDLIKTKLGL